MRTSIKRISGLAIALLVMALCLTLNVSGAQIVTNWVAYNDHAPNYVPTNGWVTAPRVTTNDMGELGGTGNLTNFLNGQQLPVMLTSMHTGTRHDFGLDVRPFTNTPAARLFLGIVDVGNDGSVIGVQFNPSDYATITFSGLNTDKHYIFRGTGVRGGSYPLRWTVATIQGAQTFVDAHINGNGGPGVITSNNFPADLGPGQAAWNGGDNREGAVIGWDFISPAPDGTFSIESSNYVGHIPGGGLAANNTYSYAISAMLLAEVEVAAPAIVTNPPPSSTVEQNRPFSLTVVASGTPLFYQWYKQGVGAVSGATFATYSVSQAALGDQGDYYVRVYNPLGSVTSTVAHVTVNADVTPPGVATAFSYPHVDFATQVATVDQVIIEFNEVVQAASATDPSHYLISGGGNPVSVVLTNERTVALMFSSALTEDSAYTVQVSGVLDLVGNNISSGGTNNPAPFRTWMRGPGNGLLFEVFDTGGGADVINLTDSPVYPDSPSFRTNLWIFDSRAVYPDDMHDDYGTRTRGVFIPPVSGDWVFLLRSEDTSRVFFNPNGLDAAGKQQLVEEVHADTDGNWGRILSGAVNLKAGRGYYIEALHKTDTGVDFIKMAARLVGAALPPGVPNSDLDTNAIMGAAVASPLAPRDLGGPLTIVKDLMDVTVEENHVATFSVQVSNPSGLPVIYKWSRDGFPINGATGPSYSVQVTGLDDGSTFGVQMAKVGSVTNSRTATLHVVEDRTPPRALEASCSYTNLSIAEVRFDEFMNSSAEDPLSYSIPGIGVSTATLESDKLTVTLTLQNALTLGETYQLEVRDVADLAGHSLSPNPTVLTFTACADAPRLSIARSGTSLNISWPAPSTGFALEQADAIVSPSSSIAWTPVGATPVVANGSNTVSVTIGPGNKIFRLRQ